MKAFWSFVLVLVLAAGGVALKAFRSGGGPTTGTVREAGGGVGGGTAGEDDGLGPMPPVNAAGLDTDAAPIEGAVAGPGTAADEPETDADPADEPVVVEVGVADEPGGAAESSGEPAPLADDTSVEGEPAGAEGEAVADETAYALVLNDRYGITGSGTAEDPYSIGFDMLVALEQDYEPKTEGKKEIPEWIKPLDGKHVVVTGFIGFPYIAPTSDECMVMLNQWDGCCIGVPPTPYDAIEVQLANPVDLSLGVPNYGTVRGVFRTDPYLVNGWLIGLYVMDEARLEDAGSTNQAGF